MKMKAVCLLFPPLVAFLVGAASKSNDEKCEPGVGVCAVGICERLPPWANLTSDQRAEYTEKDGFSEATWEKNRALGKDYDYDKLLWIHICDEEKAKLEAEGWNEENWEQVHANVDAVKLDSKYDYGLSLHYLENKVWDVIVVTDDLTIKDNTEASEEDGLFMKALERLGRKVHRASIQDKKFDWRAGKSIVLRSAWNKFDYLGHYLQFLDTVDAHSFLFNQPQLIRWQSDKTRYMRQLAEFVKVPYTVIIEHDESEYPEYSELVEMLNCTDIIIKPAGGNSGIGVKLINQDNLDLYKKKMEQYLWEEDNDMLIQCFMYSVAHDGPGEINVYLIDGEVTHAGYAVPAEGHYLIHEEYGGDGDDLVPSDAEIEFATKVYNAASGIVGVRPLYFRVDMMYDNDGELTLMEIACGTTDMNFRDEPEAADEMAQALHGFLLKKEAAYEQVHGQRPPLIELRAFEKLTDETYDSFGTPLRDGTYGKEKLWKRSSNRTIAQEKEEEASPMDQRI